MSAAVEEFTSNVTNVHLVSPSDVTGVERIMLAAQGDLQRLLSVFFSQEILVTRIYAHTSLRTGPASPAHPITQERRVHLLVGPTHKLVCIATSTVHITSPEAERLFLDEQYAIGQCYRALGRTPQFTLHTIDTRTNASNDRRELARTYTLEVEGLRCDIEEIFPDRDMFDLCEEWLKPDSERIVRTHSMMASSSAVNSESTVSRSPLNVFRALLALLLPREPQRRSTKA